MGRWGLRRTFQTEQAIEDLSLYDNVAMVEEHSRNNGGTSRRDDVLGALAFVGLGDRDPNKKVGTLGARERRLVRLEACRKPVRSGGDDQVRHLASQTCREFPQRFPQ